ncbi:hypothetical protein Cni_G25644 [Canna indica]|uniref:Nucleoporin protein Ndc1-Nup n=1 Tax=Canna indica TaxID=4628 RepID=A0AAQ3L274_9LILI|nr:hypothetical protein Cni_G25644 [Canna indica]
MSSSSATASTSSPSSLADEVVKNRWLGFLIWQSIVSAAVHIPASLLLRQFSGPSSSSSSAAALLFSFLAFHLSLLLLSLAFFLLSSPHPDPAASLPDLAAAALRVSLKSLVGGFSRPSFTAVFARRARRAVASAVFLLICGVAGFLSAVAICRDEKSIVGVAFRGLVFGLVYGLHYVSRKRWILQFPIIQRPLFYSFKIGLSSSLKRAMKLSVQAYVCSSILVLFMPDQFKSKTTTRKFIVQQLNFYLGLLTVSICWELSHHLVQIVHTRRCIFAPPQGSAAAGTNPSETLLETLEESNQRSLVQYLAYLDLCIVSEGNSEPWRRAAFFEETGETYRRVTNVCLKPIEQLTSRLAEGLEGLTMGESDFLSKQLNSPAHIQMDSRIHEALNDFQICSWCARALGALTARSKLEDRCGVAQLTGCNKAVVSTLLSCLLAVEACLGKKTSAQPTHMLGPASIRWAKMNPGKRDVSPMTSKRRSAILHAKAYAMADVLRTSVYQVVSSFQLDMHANAKPSVLENWIVEGKPLYSTREILMEKLCIFLCYSAV